MEIINLRKVVKFISTNKARESDARTLFALINCSKFGNCSSNCCVKKGISLMPRTISSYSVSWNKTKSCNILRIAARVIASITQNSIFWFGWPHMKLWTDRPNITPLDEIAQDGILKSAVNFIGPFNIQLYRGNFLKTTVKIWKTRLPSTPEYLSVIKRRKPSAATSIASKMIAIICASELDKYFLKDRVEKAHDILFMSSFVFSLGSN